LQLNDNVAANTGKCKLIIERTKGPWTYAYTKYNLYLDGQLVKKLVKDETFTIELSNGKHNIYFDAFNTQKTDSYEFTGNNNEIKYTVSSYSAIDLLTRASQSDYRDKLFVNKIYETEPGSYKG
jgi:hypothetical protein